MLDVQTWNLVGKNHHVIFDNFFSTVKFVEDLLDLEDSTYSWETKRANRKDFPKELAANNPDVKHLERFLKGTSCKQSQCQALEARRGTISPKKRGCYSLER